MTYPNLIYSGYVSNRMDTRTNIKVRTETHQALADLKRHPRQTFDEVIVEMINKKPKEV